MAENKTEEMLMKLNTVTETLSAMSKAEDEMPEGRKSYSIVFDAMSKTLKEVSEYFTKEFQEP